MEIEIDNERVHREVVDKLVVALHHDCKVIVEEAVKGAFLVELRKRAVEHFKQIVDTATFFDGKTFQQYVELLVTKPSVAGVGRYGRPRLMDHIERHITSTLDDVVRDVVKPYVDSVKQKLVETVLKNA
jgi:hypothetical protein